MSSITFTDNEIDKIMNAIISSVVDTSRQLQDKVYKMMEEHKSANNQED